MGVGSRLRQAREERQLSLADVAGRTRVPRHQLQAIETEDYRRLAPGISGRGHVRAYAAAVGLDPEIVASELRAELSAVDVEEHENDAFRLRMDPPDHAEAVVRHVRGPILAAVLIALSALAVLIWVGWDRAQPERPSVSAPLPAIASPFGGTEVLLRVTG